MSYVIPLINLPYLSHVLGVDKFGLVFFAFAFMQYFIMLTDYGFGLSATREIAVNRHNKNNLSTTDTTLNNYAQNNIDMIADADRKLNKVFSSCWKNVGKISENENSNVIQFPKRTSA